MNPTQAATILSQHNIWRCHNGDEPMEMQSSKLLGEAIDVAVAHLLVDASSSRNLLVQAIAAENKEWTGDHRKPVACALACVLERFDAMEGHKA